MQRAAIFLDRDGTINEDIGYITSPDQFVIYPWSAEALRIIKDAGYLSVVVTNQSCVARGYCSESDIQAVNDRMTAELAGEGAIIDAVFYCPHHPEGIDDQYRLACDCRKPGPGMMLRAAKELGIALDRSYVIGDKVSDLEMALAVGAKPVLVLTGYGELTRKHLLPAGRLPGIVSKNLLEAVQEIVK